MLYLCSTQHSLLSAEPFITNGNRYAMIEVDSFILRNVVHFNEAVVPVRKNSGLVVVSGLNKDSRIAADQNNGAGKSLLFSALPNARFGAAPSSSLKNTKKDMLDSSKSEIEIRFYDNQGRKMRFIQKPSKWVIYENGKDIEARTVAIQQVKMAEYFPITEEEFYAYNYLSSIQGQRVHFQVDKPAERLKFITSIFQLDSYDKLKKYFTKMLGKIADEQTKFTVLESKLLNINSQLDKLAWNAEEATNAETAKTEFVDLKKQRDKLSKRVNKTESLLQSLASYHKQLNKRIELLKNFPYEGEVAEIATKLRSRLETIQKYDAYLEKLETYKNNTKRIRKILDELKQEDVPSKEKIEKTIGKLNAKLRELSEQLESSVATVKQALKYQNIIDNIAEELRDLGFNKPKSVDVKTDIDDELSVVRSTVKLKRLLDHDHKSGCPTCLQPVDFKRISTTVKRAEKRLSELEVLKQAREMYLRYVEARNSINELNPLSKEELKEAEEAVRVVEAEYDVAKELLRKRNKIDGLEEDLENIEKPKEPNKKPPKNAREDDIREALQQCREIEKINHAIDSMESDNPQLTEFASASSLEQLREEYNTHQEKLKALDKRYQKLMRAVSEYDLRLGEYRVLSKQKVELELEIKAAQPLLAKRDLYKALERAYGPKGLKVNKANEIVGLLEANLNRYSNLIFAEPFKFNVYANEQGVFCDVDRNNGKVSDVRLLSGSESDAFKLLFMLSLLLMVPSDRRTNFVVLDEPDSHMDKPTRVLFAERFIPFLREVVPHVFVITPLDHHIYREYDHWTVVKEDGVSRLVKKGVE